MQNNASKTVGVFGHHFIPMFPCVVFAPNVLIERNSVEHGLWAMLCGILHSRDITVLNRKGK